MFDSAVAHGTLEDCITVFRCLRGERCHIAGFIVLAEWSKWWRRVLEGVPGGRSIYATPARPSAQRLGRPSAAMRAHSAAVDAANTGTETPQRPQTAPEIGTPPQKPLSSCGHHLLLYGTRARQRCDIHLVPRPPSFLYTLIGFCYTFVEIALPC